VVLSDTGDVVEVLLGQHERIKAMFAEVARAVGPERLRLFQDLTALLHTHEAGEQKVVHAAMRNLTADSEDVALARVAEENEGDTLITELLALGTEHPDFGATFGKLHDAVLRHAGREEAEEFPVLRQRMSAERLHLLADEFRAVQAML